MASSAPLLWVMALVEKNKAQNLSNASHEREVAMESNFALRLGK